MMGVLQLDPGLEPVRQLFRTEAVDKGDVADIFGVEENTVSVWMARAKSNPKPLSFIPPVTKISNSPVWLRSDIIAWGIATGRIVMPTEEADEEEG